MKNYKNRQELRGEAIYKVKDTGPEGKGMQSVSRARLAGKHVAFAGSSPCAQPSAQQLCVLGRGAGPMTTASEPYSLSQKLKLSGHRLGNLQAQLTGQHLGSSSRCENPRPFLTPFDI